MRIIEIAALENGAHRNQTSNMSVIHDGWAVIPETMETPNFPFGTVTAEEINGVMTVTDWTPGTMPEPEPAPEPPTTEERLNSLESDNKLLKQQLQAASDQNDFLEDCIAEMAGIVYA